MRHGLAIATAVVLLHGQAVYAHVPYFEQQDLSADAPFLIEDIEQSKAIYAYLDSAEDVDVLLLIVREPVRIYAKTIIPYCREYRDFRPSFALTGPGLPEPGDGFPPAREPGHGRILRHDEPDGATRPSMYEFFSNQFYFEGPILDINVTEPGNYWLWFWDDSDAVGDYVAIVGKREVFSVEDIRRSFWNTPDIRRRGYLHVDCEEPDDLAANE